MTWDNLSWWDSTHSISAFKKLEEGKHRPDRDLIFAAMDECPLDKVKVVLCGQDPYPGVDTEGNPYATGLSFSIPAGSLFTPTLSSLFLEYTSDLHYPTPTSGDLTPWAKEGVLLWNIYLSCQNSRSLSHRWLEWEELTKEVFDVTSKRGSVFILLGAVPRQFKEYISEEDSFILEAPHPMSDVYPKRKGIPRSSFKGSRIFTKCNDLLCNMKLGAIDWRLK